MSRTVLVKIENLKIADLMDAGRGASGVGQDFQHNRSKCLQAYQFIPFHFHSISSRAGQCRRISKPQGKSMICAPKTHHQNLCFKFEVKLLESRKALRSTMAVNYAVFPLGPSFDSSRFTPNLKQRFWWWVHLRIGDCSEPKSQKLKPSKKN